MATDPRNAETDPLGFPLDGADDGAFGANIPARRSALSRLRGGAGLTLKRSASYGLMVTLVLTLLGIYFWQRIIYVIPAGHGGVLYRTFGDGTVTDYVYPEGFHAIFPWDRLSDYDTKVQLVLSDITVLTNKGLPIELKLAIRYHPEYDMLGLLHQKVGPDYVQKIVLPQVESVLRRNIGKEEPEAIYTNKEGVLTNIIARAIEETSEKFVSIDDIIIREVILPDDVRRAINEKLVYQQRDQAYEFRLTAEQKESERKKIEAEGIRVSQEIVNRSLTANLLEWEHIKAINDLSRSNNAKVVVMDTGKQVPPLIIPTP
jgi:regulator of protease activity HflC (stomatin/prohibitin superfamily)